MIVDRAACFPNLCELLKGARRQWSEEHYERVLQTILNDVQRAADARQLKMLVHLASRERAAQILEHREHMEHNWMPHQLLTEAFRTAQTTRRSRDDGFLEAAFQDTAVRTWNMKVMTYTLGHELLLQVSPNPLVLPPRPDRPVPIGGPDQGDRD